MTAPSEGVDDLGGLPDKRTTTVAMDFGRIDLDDDLVLYLFGTPGQYRFWFMWDQLVHGAVGAVVLVDTRRLIDSFPVLDYFERAGIPFVVGVNGFDGQFPYSEDQVREALHLRDPNTPIRMLDARSRDEARGALLALLDMLIIKAGSRRAADTRDAPRRR